MLKGIPVGMLTTETSGGEVRSRPMLVHEIDEDGWLWFLTDRSSRKACELIHNPHTSIAFQSSGGDRYIAVQGTAVVVRDDLQLKKVWNATYRSWFPKGRHDPAIVLVAVRITRAEYWLVPRTRLSRTAGALKAAVTGRRHESGRHGVLDLRPMVA